MARDRKPGLVMVETLRDPYEYSQRQINLACLICSVLDRGKLIVCEEPEEE